MPTPDPQALRALAHPLRWQLLDLLDTETTATATRCAQVTGESVASCAYHLGILAKYGYVAQDTERHGREKPWRLLQRSQDLRPEGMEPEAELWADAAADVFFDHEFTRFRTRVHAAGAEAKAWRPWFTGATFMMTAAELAEVREQISALLEPFAARDGKPELYPADGRAVRIFAATSTAPASDASGTDTTGVSATSTAPAPAASIAAATEVPTASTGAPETSTPPPATGSASAATDLPADAPTPTTGPKPHSSARQEPRA